MLEFAKSVFNDLMCIITFEIMEEDWNGASSEREFEIAFGAERASKLASDVIMVATFLVCCLIKKCVAAWAVSDCLKVCFFLWRDNHVSACITILSLLCDGLCLKVAKKTNNAVFSAPKFDVCVVLMLCL